MLPGTATHVWMWLDSLWQDARFSARLLARSRTVTAVSVLSLALGIGVNLSVFSFVNALFLRPIPGVADVDSLVAIHHRSRDKGNFTSASYPDFEYYRRHATSFSGLVAYAPFGTTVRARDAAEGAAGEIVSDGYFQVLACAAPR